MKRRALLLTGLLVGAGVAAGGAATIGGGCQEETPAPGCRTPDDCVAAGMVGASCIDERCQFIGKAEGSVRLADLMPSGTLHVVAYPASAIVAGIGPKSGVAALGAAVSVATPAYPQAFQLTGLPDGEFMLYAFVDVGGDTESEARACVGDVIGLRAFTVAAGVARSDDDAHATEIDTYLSLDVADDSLCE